VQIVQSPENPSRLVLEVTISGLPVVLLGQADVPHPVEDPLDADAALGPG
jgi:hypothetical protein